MKNPVSTLLAISLSFSAFAAQPVSMRSLLSEMTDRDAAARFQDYRCLQASSYDRHSVAKGEKGWFANSDRSWFIRKETDEGRREFVMMEDNGPGAVVRFWMTFSPESAKGMIRIYIDGSKTPSIEGPAIDILSGGALCPYPLAASVSELRPIDKRGHNLYLPIPYAKGCKITFESEYVDEDHPGAVGAKTGKIYYNIEYRSYPAGTRVRSFEKAEFAKVSDYVKDVCTDLLQKETRCDRITGTTDLNCLIPASGSKSFSIRGGGAIRHLAMKVEADNMEDALRNLIVEIQFDGQSTVYVPAGDFFGTGYKYRKSSTWFTRTDEDGLMHSFWTMPFRKGCSIILHNNSSSRISLSNAKAEYGPWKWDRKSMYFASDWHQYTDLPLGKGYERDLGFLRAEGKGAYAGTCVCLRNGISKWWGEGDEKIYVDGESFPSHFGTGSEDYFGYAWSSPAIFEHPFIAQPCGDGARVPGFVCNTRWRVLDAIPFKKSIDFDMEILQETAGSMDYAVTNYWYVIPVSTPTR